MASSIITSGDSDSGFNWLIKKCFGGDGSVSTTTEAYPNKWEIGLSSTVPTSSNTTIGARVPYTYTVAEACDAVTGWANGGTGQSEVLNETSGEFNQGTGCLNVPTNTGAGTFTKTLAAGVNLETGEKDVYVWVYVSTLTNFTSAIVVLGTGGVGNSNEYDFLAASLTAGVWNTLRIPYGTTADTTNGTGLDQTDWDTAQLILTVADNFTGTMLRMDGWHYATDAQHLKDDESGYPVHNTTQHTLIYLDKYTTAQANGYKIQEVGFVNSNEKLFNHGTFNPVNKTTAKELRITTIMKFENKT